MLVKQAWLLGLLLIDSTDFWPFRQNAFHWKSQKTISNRLTQNSRNLSPIIEVQGGH